jgi:histone H3/H4
MDRFYDQNSTAGRGDVVGELPNAVVKRLLSKHGDGLRVSGSAIEQAVAAAEDYIGRLAREAHASAIADKRKTIMDTDIQKAREKLT